MKKKALIIAFAAMLGCGTNAQLVSLSNDGKGPFWVDLDRVYNYNQYEKSRWGLGLRYGYTADELKNKRLWYNRLMAGAYIGYGYADQRFKWGVDAGYWTDLKHQGKVYAAYFHDLTAEATRSLNTYSLVNFNATGSFMNHFFSVPVK